MPLLTLFAGAAGTPSFTATVAGDFGGLTVEAGAEQRLELTIALDFAGLTADVAAEQRLSGIVAADFGGLAVDAVVEQLDLATATGDFGGLTLLAGAEQIADATVVGDFAGLAADALAEQGNIAGVALDFSGLTTDVVAEQVVIADDTLDFAGLVLDVAASAEQLGSPPDVTGDVVLDFGGLTADAAASIPVETPDDGMVGLVPQIRRRPRLHREARATLDFAALDADALTEQVVTAELNGDFGGLEVEARLEVLASAAPLTPPITRAPSAPRRAVPTIDPRNASVVQGVPITPGARVAQAPDPASSPVFVAQAALTFAPLEWSAEADAEDLDGLLHALAVAESDDDIIFALVEA